MTAFATMKNKQARPQRVTRIAKKLTARHERKLSKDAKRWGSKPLRRKEFSLRRRMMIAYDLETTRIKANETPQPKYLTAYGADFRASTRIDSYDHLLTLIVNRFLVPEHNRCRFVAWNGNNFDVYIVARALLASDDYTIRPYLTRSKNLRGLKVIRKEKWKNPKGRMITLSWEFLDGISMTGLVGYSLKKFLEQFAPDFGKLEGPNFEKEEFDAGNPDHVRYADRDSEGLYHGMMRYEDIVADHFDMGLQPTCGNLGIKIFQMNMPGTATVWKPSFGALDAIRNQVLRGGFCYRNRRFDGPIWKYDLNQAYAAAMREAKLPAGRCYWNPAVVGADGKALWKTKGVINPYAQVFIARVRGRLGARSHSIPFYCRDMEGEAVFAKDEIPETWITSIEYKQLVAEGARLEVAEAYFWDENFSMTEFVNALEEARVNAVGGPSGAIGTVIKNIGNHSYGKTVERLDGIELIMALNCPDGFNQYQCENDQLQCVWYRFAPPVMREYHQPQLGAFITAHVRMVLRRAILKAPHAWLYSDTDCNAFSEPVPGLDIDAKRYGAWKIEEEGKPYLIIEKKVYCSKDGKHARARGLNVKRLTPEDFARWHAGQPPTQVQVQRNNFVHFIGGGEMFKERKKVGQRL